MRNLSHFVGIDHPEKVFLTNHRGFSLVEILVVSGIISIIGLALASILSQSSSTQRQLTQKIDQLTFRSYLVDLMADETTCSCMINDIPVKANDKNHVVPLNMLREGCNTDPNRFLAKADQPLPGSTGLTVNELSFGKVEALGGSNYRGTLRVSFNYLDGIKRRPLELETMFTLPNPGQTAIGPSACISANGAGRVYRCSIITTQDPGEENIGTYVRAKMCVLQTVAFDQSSSGTTQCWAQEAPSGWTLRMIQKDSPGQCSWLCFGNLAPTPPGFCQEL